MAKWGSIRLPRTYAVGLLERDLAAVTERYRSHPQPGPYHKGDWTGISLHSQGGREGAFPSAPGLEPYAKTAALAVAPYLEEILDGLACPKEVVRLLALPPGATIGEHFDLHTSFPYGLIRLHVPIRTHPEVRFVIDGERVDMKPGELWYGDFQRVHSVHNESPVNRVHMVIDVQINEWLLSLFPAEFVAERRAEGISFCRTPSASPDAGALRRYVCDFEIPRAVVPILTIGQSLMKRTTGARGAARLVDGRLVVLVDGEPTFGLEHVSDHTFAITGLGAGCSLEFDVDGPDVSGVTLVLKGLPENLFAARLGARRFAGDILPEQRISLPVERPSASAPADGGEGGTR